VFVVVLIFVGVDLPGSGSNPVAGSCDEGIETSGSIIGLFFIVREI
jgi:hypothetical protein